MSDFAELRVLIVDDDAFMREILDQILRQLGVCEIWKVGDGLTALEIVDHAYPPIDVILCDLDMSGMDGISCIRHLSERDFAGGILVMSGSGERLVSSVADLVHEHRLHLLGALSKPPNTRDIADALSTYDRRAHRDRARAQMADTETPFTVEHLRAGLAKGYPDIAVQPQVTIHGRRVVGCEVLLRWKDPDRGIISPAEVIQIAEANDLIHELTLQIMRRSVRCLATFHRRGLRVRMSVNVSAMNLERTAFPDELAAIVAEANLSPRDMVIEVTEGRIFDQPAVTTDVLARLSLFGFGLSIDDFGTGYSGLEKLRNLPFTELKIDRAFVQGASIDPSLAVILQTAVTLGQSLGMTVVAEGVENQVDWDFLASTGCDEVQGYFVAKPMQPEDFAGWITEWQRTTIAMLPLG